MGVLHAHQARQTIPPNAGTGSAAASATPAGAAAPAATGDKK